MKLEKIVPRNENFADWYTSVITTAKLIDYSSVKGVMIFQPNGWAIWQNIVHELDSKFKELNISNVQLPTFIKYNEFIKEKEHVEGFAPELFLVTKQGNNELEEPLVIRPTSEVLFCNYYKKIVNSYKDLPIKYNQWCNVFRVEKNTKPFLRNSEFFWQELHTVHSDSTDAMNSTIQLIDLYEKFVREFLCIPVLKGEKTPGERFAGADNTFTIEALMQDGQVLQCGTSHYLGQNFAKTFDIQFQNKDNQYEHVYQTSAGMSTRIIGAIIMTHSDDKGLVLPFGVAPTQISILCMFADKEPKVNEVANKIKNELSKYRVCVDNQSSKGFGYRISEQEVIGTPIVIIIGPKDLENNQVTLIRRDNGVKQLIKLNELVSNVDIQVKEYQDSLYKKAHDRLNKSIVEVNTLEDLVKVVNDHCIAKAPWGGSVEDEKKLKEQTGISPRCIVSKTTKNEKCFFTNKKATHIVYFARAY